MLDTTLSARVDDGDVMLALTVTNRGADPVTIRFRSGQRGEFVAYGLDDETAGSDRACWRYGDGKLFTQAIGEERIEPGSSATYEAVWTDPPEGVHRLVGKIVGEVTGEVADEEMPSSGARSPPSAETTVRIG